MEIADRFLAAAGVTAGMLALQPEAGIPLPLRWRQASGLRQFGVSGGFDAIGLVYRPRPGGIDSVRVLHGKRDVKRLLED